MHGPKAAASHDCIEASLRWVKSERTDGRYVCWPTVGHVSASTMFVAWEPLVRSYLTYSQRWTGFLCPYSQLSVRLVSAASRPSNGNGLD